MAVVVAWTALLGLLFSENTSVDEPFPECEYAPIDLDAGDSVWIVVVSSIDGGGSPPGSVPSSRGGQDLGLLWSSHYPSLNPGWWVVYAGPYVDEGAANSARTSVGGSAYLRRLSSDDLDDR